MEEITNIGIDHRKLVNSIKKRQEHMEKQRHEWEERWERIAELICPARELVPDKDRDHEMGEKVGTELFDGTAPAAHRSLVRGFCGHLVSRAVRWHTYKFRNLALENNHTAKILLQETEEAMYAALNRGNFYDEIETAVYDASGIGTAGVLSKESSRLDRTIYDARHPWELYVMENEDHDVDLVHRKFQLTVKKLVEKFGEDKLTDNIKQAIKNDTLGDKKWVIHAIIPNHLVQMLKKQYRNTRMKAPAYRKYVSVYILADEGDHVEPLHIGGYDEMPLHVWRWYKDHLGPYGMSPAFLALIEAEGLNRLSESMLRAAQLSVEPPMMIPESLKRHVRLHPNGYTYYQELAKERIEPVFQGINYPIGADREERYIKAIREHFMVDFFLMLNQATRQKTATEVMELQGEKAALLGSAVGKLESELLDPVLRRTYKIEYDAGRMPPMPDELLEITQGAVQIEYIGPLAQIQRRAFKSRGLTSALEVAAPVFGAFPETRDAIDPDGLIREIMDIFGMPQQALRPQEMVDQIRAQRAKLMEEQRQIENAKAMAEIVPKLDPGGFQGLQKVRLGMGTGAI